MRLRHVTAPETRPRYAAAAEALPICATPHAPADGAAAVSASLSPHDFAACAVFSRRQHADALRYAISICAECQAPFMLCAIRHQAARVIDAAHHAVATASANPSSAAPPRYAQLARYALRYYDAIASMPRHAFAFQYLFRVR